MDERDPGGDLADLREQNLRRILGALLGARKGLTQPAIVELTGLSRSTVSSLLGRHLGGVLQTTTRRNGENSGRPVKSWGIDPRACYVVGVDIGQTHVSAVVLDAFGERVVGPIREPVDGVLGDPHRTLALAADLVERVVRPTEVECDDIAAIVVGLPGPVDATTGVMADDATRAWAGIDVREEIRKRWPHDTVPRRLADNNANLGALAEHRFGAGRGVESLLLLDWASGIGGGAILGGRLWRGHSGVAAELGHLPVSATDEEAAAMGFPAAREDWQRCPRCGQVDCLERLAGGFTVAAATGLPNLAAVVGSALGESHREATERSRAVLKVAAKLIGRAIGPTLTLLDVECVVLAGVVGQPALYSLLVEDLSEGLAETALRRARTDASLEIGALGADAPVLGAAILGLDEHGVDFLLAKAAGPSGSAGPPRTPVGSSR